MRQESKIDLSLVIPVFNEDRYLLKLFDGLLKYFNHKIDISISRELIYQYCLRFVDLIFALGGRL